jgi:hypothetical protein
MQVPQLTMRETPQLSGAVTLPQSLTRRKQKEESLSGVQAASGSFGPAS